MPLLRPRIRARWERFRSEVTWGPAMISATIDAKGCFSRGARHPALLAHSKKPRFRARVQASRSPIAPWKNVARERASKRRDGPIAELARSSFRKRSGTMFHRSGIGDGIFLLRHGFIRSTNSNDYPRKIFPRWNFLETAGSIAHLFVTKDPVRRAGPTSLQIILAPPRSWSWPRGRREGGREGARRARPPARTEHTLART